MENTNGTDGCMAPSSIGRSVCHGAYDVSLLRRAEGKTKEGQGTTGCPDTFYRSDRRSEVNHGNVVEYIRARETPMILFSQKNGELDQLAATFNQKVQATKNDVRRLNSILETITAETCPLSPCDDCVLVRCMLRRNGTNN